MPVNDLHLRTYVKWEYDCLISIPKAAGAIMQLVTLFFYNHDLEKKPSFGMFPQNISTGILEYETFWVIFKTLWSAISFPTFFSFSRVT